MAKTAGRPVPRWVSEAQSKTKFGKLELLLHTSDVMRKSHHPVPRWVSEAMRRLWGHETFLIVGKFIEMPFKLECDRPQR